MKVLYNCQSFYINDSERFIVDTIEIERIFLYSDLTKIVKVAELIN